jgi:hypothetical protein
VISWAGRSRSFAHRGLGATAGVGHYGHRHSSRGSDQMGGDEHFIRLQKRAVLVKGTCNSSSSMGSHQMCGEERKI